MGVVEVWSPLAVEINDRTSALAFLADPGEVLVMTASAMRCVMWCWPCAGFVGLVGGGGAGSDGVDCAGAGVGFVTVTVAEGFPVAYVLKARFITRLNKTQLHNASSYALHCRE